MDQTEPLDIPLINNRPTTKDAQYIYYNNIAILISTTSFFYNILEGAVSVYFGEVTDSLSLFFFGVQSFVEVLSSVIVLWKVMTSYAENKQQLRMEKRATVFIGGLFIFLCIGILIDGIFSLVDHSEPTTTVPNIIVSAIATFIMLFLYIIKKKLARELNSSTIQSDAQCSLACIRITVFLLLGSIIYHFWDAVWWIDGAMALVLGVLFGKEGVQMLLWASSKDFNGGCCGGCAKMPDQSQRATAVKVACTTSLTQNEYKGFDSEDQVAKKGADKCCKAGKCSKKTENQSVPSTQLLASDLESQDLMNYTETAEVKPKSGGGCCKGGKCSKTSENQKTTPVDVILEVTDKEEAESKAQQEVLVQPVPKKCCSGGGCKKATESQVTVSTETRTIFNEIEIKPKEEIVPEKKVGGCCKGGKCTKSSGNQIKTSPEIIPEAITLEKVNQEQETREVLAPKSCCKGGGCAKKIENQVSAPVENPISLPVNEGFPPEIVEVKAEEQPAQKSGGCCKGGKCTKSQNPVIIEPVPEVVIVDKVEPEAQPVTKGCCKGGKCSKKTEEINLATDKEISLI